MAAIFCKPAPSSQDSQARIVQRDSESATCPPQRSSKGPIDGSLSRASGVAVLRRLVCIGFWVPAAPMAVRASSPKGNAALAAGGCQTRFGRERSLGRSEKQALAGWAKEGNAAVVQPDHGQSFILRGFKIEALRRPFRQMETPERILERSPPTLHGSMA